MSQASTTPETQQSRYDGTDYICKNCGSEIMVKHRGDESKGYGRTDYTCTCETKMQLEHAGAEAKPTI
jgi:ssDNA-binding Zn-finger/Zn-ribbon topoisomerase 1